MNKQIKKPTSVAGLLFSNDRKDVLLIQRRDVPVWVLPGGGIEAEETSEQAIIREMFEETGFHVNIDRLVGIYYPINRLAQVTCLYECSIVSGKSSLSSETQGIQFYPLTELPLMPPPYLEWIQDGMELSPTKIKQLSSITYACLCKYFFTHPVLVFRFLCARMGFPLNDR